jgi:hypothetical protein
LKVQDLPGIRQVPGTLDSYAPDAPQHDVRELPVEVLIGRGRDASDVPITMVFGQHLLENFSVITEEVDPGSTANAVDVS